MSVDILSFCTKYSAPPILPGIYFAGQNFVATEAFGKRNIEWTFENIFFMYQSSETVKLKKEPRYSFGSRLKETNMEMILMEHKWKEDKKDVHFFEIWDGNSKCPMFVGLQSALQNSKYWPRVLLWWFVFLLPAKYKGWNFSFK